MSKGNENYWRMDQNMHDKWDNKLDKQNEKDSKEIRRAPHPKKLYAECI